MTNFLFIGSLNILMWKIWIKIIPVLTSVIAAIESSVWKLNTVYSVRFQEFSCAVV